MLLGTCGYMTEQKFDVHPQFNATIFPDDKLPGTYHMTVWVKRIGERIDDEVERAIEFEVLSRDINGHPSYFDKYAELNMFQHSAWSMAAGASAP